jgi:phosphohistidine phosphatase
MAAYLAEAGIRPALVLCSTALRARETLDSLRSSLGEDVDVWMEDGLYGADNRELLDRLRRLPPAVPSAMVIGHNPALQDLALDLAGGGDEATLARLNQKFPTGGLSTLLVDGAWETLSSGSATLTALVVPRELPSG